MIPILLKHCVQEDLEGQEKLEITTLDNVVSKYAFMI